MNFEQAMQVVQQYTQDWALPGLLETLEQMQNSVDGDHRNSVDELTDQERRAFRVVYNSMAKLFAPA